MPALDSLERHLLGYMLFPKGSDRLEDYFEAVLARVRHPYEGWLHIWNAPSRSGG